MGEGPAHGGCCHPWSIKKMLHELAYRLIWWKHFPNCSFIFPYDASINLRKSTVSAQARHYFYSLDQKQKLSFNGLYIYNYNKKTGEIQGPTKGKGTGHSGVSLQSLTPTKSQEFHHSHHLLQRLPVLRQCSLFYRDISKYIKIAMN